MVINFYDIDLEQATHTLGSIDWPVWITRFAVVLTLAILGIIWRFGRKVYKEWTGAQPLINNLKDNIKILEITVKELQTKLEDKDVSNRMLGSSNEQYRRDMENVIKNNREMHERIGRVEQELSSYKKIIDHYEDENKRLKERVAKLESILASHDIKED